MKIVVFKFRKSDSRYNIGFLKDEHTIVDATAVIATDGLDAQRINEVYDLENAVCNEVEAAIRDSELPEILLERVILCSPVPRPGKVICIGLNYRNHAIESGMDIPTSPIIFSKFVTSVAGHKDDIVIPPGSLQTDYEAELAVIIGRKAKNISAADAMEYVFGYANCNDVSARDFQFADGQWQRGKSCDTFLPLGPYILKKNEVEDPHKLSIKLRLNGETMQDSTTDELIFKIPEIIEFLSSSITLEPGDIIATGTPPGVGFARKPPVYLKAGDICEVEIEGLGILRNSVK